MKKAVVLLFVSVLFPSLVLARTWGYGDGGYDYRDNNEPVRLSEAIGILGHRNVITPEYTQDIFRQINTRSLPRNPLVPYSRETLRECREACLLVFVPKSFTLRDLVDNHEVRRHITAQFRSYRTSMWYAQQQQFGYRQVGSGWYLLMPVRGHGFDLADRFRGESYAPAALIAYAIAALNIHPVGECGRLYAGDRSDERESFVYLTRRGNTIEVKMYTVVNGCTVFILPPDQLH